MNRDSLRKRAASQSTESPQVTKRNTALHVGLCTVLACCPLQPLSSGEEDEDEDEDEDKEEEEEGEAQESDEDLDQCKDDEDEDDTDLIDPDIHQPPQEPPDEEVGFKAASGRVVQPS